jgi:hypothetical protein
MPLNFIEFLDHCARLILLKKMGGGLPLHPPDAARILRQSRAAAVVWNFDRLSRSLWDVLTIMEQIAGSKAGLTRMVRTSWLGTMLQLIGSVSRGPA